ncbi:TPA: hypothetical protein ACFCAO_001403 [Neisseria gonorrhoeae]
MLLPKPSPILPFFGGQALGKLWIKNILFCSLKKCRLKILEAQNKPISPTALFFDFVVLP